MHGRRTYSRDGRFHPTVSRPNAGDELPRFIQRPEQLCGPLVPGKGILLEAAADHCHELRRLRAKRLKWRRILLVLPHEFGCRSGLERPLAREHLVEHDP